MSADAESHDDVAGLFKRLGRRDDTRQYHDFSASPSLPGARPDAAPPPVPDAAVLTVEPASAQVAPPPAVPTMGTPSTSLRALFQRLLEAPLQPSAQSPLARLRIR